MTRRTWMPRRAARLGLTVLTAAVLLLAACDDDDEGAGSGVTPTPTETNNGPDTTVGVPEIDRAINLVLVGDTAGLASAVELTEVECAAPNQDAIGGNPTCEEGETPGDIISAFPAAACEGYWVRDPSQILQTFVNDVVALYAVVGAPASPPQDTFFPFGTHTVIFRANTAVGGEGYTLTLDDGAIVSLQTGCRPPQDFMTFQGEALPVLLGPIEADSGSSEQTSGSTGNDSSGDANDTLAATFGAARDDAAERFGLSVAAISLKRAESVVWSNACLGIDSEGACAEVLVSGWVLWIQAGDSLHRYHTDRAQQDMRWAEGPLVLGTTSIPELALPVGATLDIDG